MSHLYFARRKRPKLSTYSEFVVNDNNTSTNTQHVSDPSSLLRLGAVVWIRLYGL